MISNRSRKSTLNSLLSTDLSWRNCRGQTIITSSNITSNKYREVFVRYAKNFGHAGLLQSARGMTADLYTYIFIYTYIVYMYIYIHTLCTHGRATHTLTKSHTHRHRSPPRLPIADAARRPFLVPRLSTSSFSFSPSISLAWNEPRRASFSHRRRHVRPSVRSHSDQRRYERTTVRQRPTVFWPATRRHAPYPPRSTCPIDRRDTEETIARSIACDHDPPLPLASHVHVSTAPRRAAPLLNRRAKFQARFHGGFQPELCRFENERARN